MVIEIEPHRVSRGLKVIAALLVVFALLAVPAVASGGEETRSTVEFGPDMAVSAGDIELSKEVLLSGVFFNLSIDVYNLGDEDAHDVTVDLVVDSVPVTQVVLTEVKVDKSFKAGFELSLVQGTHTIGVLVDRDDTIDERREDNNGASIEVVVRGLPDAVIKPGGVTVDNEHPMEGEILTLRAEVWNLGESAASFVVISFWDGPVGEGFLIANKTTSIPASEMKVVTTQWDTSDKGGTHEINVNVTRVLPGEEDPSNNQASITVLIFTEWDLVIDGGPQGTGDVLIDQVWTQDGFVTVRAGATLTIEGVVFEFLQDYPNQFALFVEDGGSLVLDRATVQSAQPLLVILEDGTSLSLLGGSSLIANVMVDGDVEVTIDTSILVGGMAGNATTVTVTASEITGPLDLGMCELVVHDSLLSSQEGCVLKAVDAVVVDSAIAGTDRSMDLATGTVVELRNVTCGGVMTDATSKAFVFRRVEVLVVDESNLVIPGAAVDICHYINGSVVGSDVNGDDGKVEIEVLSDVLTGGTSHFIGNYLIRSTFSGEEGTESLLLDPFPLMDPESNLPKATVVLPPIEPRTLVPVTYGDMHIEAGENQTFTADFIQDGSIIVKGRLVVSSAILTVLQDRDHQFYVVVEGDGRLILQGGQLTSTMPLNVYLYDNATLEMNPGSSLKVNAVVSQDGATVSGHASTLQTRLLLRGGPVSLTSSCQVTSDIIVIETSNLQIEGGKMTVDELTVDAPAVAIDNVDVDAKHVTLHANFANVTDSSFGMETFNVEATILTVRGSSLNANGDLNLSVATYYMDSSSSNVPLKSDRSDAKYYLYDADVPRPFLLGDATVLVYWYLTTQVRDVLGNPVSSIDVDAAYTSNGTSVTTGVTNDDGDVRFPLLGSIVGPDGEYFVGNYKITVHHPYDELKSRVGHVNLDKAKTMMVRFDDPMVPPTMVGIEIHVENTTVFAGSVFNVTGTATAIFPTVQSALAYGYASISLWNESDSWNDEATLGPDGAFRFEVPAPNRTGVFYLKVVATPTGPYAGVDPGTSRTLTLDVVPPGPSWIRVVLDTNRIDNFPAGESLTIRGTVVYDTPGGGPAPEARVFVEGALVSPPRQTTADGLGVFAIVVPGPEFFGQYDYFISAVDDKKGIETEVDAKLTVLARKVETTEETRDLQWLWIAILVVVVVVGSLAAVLTYWHISTRDRMVECGECGTMVPDNATECPKCGIEFEVEVAKCSVCESWIKSDAETCPYCGTPFKDMEDLEAEDAREEEEEVEPPVTVDAEVDEGEVPEDLPPMAPAVVDDEVEVEVSEESVKTVPEGIKKEVRPKPVVRKRQVSEEDLNGNESMNGNRVRPVVRKVVSKEASPDLEEEFDLVDREDTEDE